MKKTRRKLLSLQKKQVMTVSELWHSKLFNESVRQCLPGKSFKYQIEKQRARLPSFP